MKNRHLPQLDGLRGIAVLIVVLGHLAVFSFGFRNARFGAIPPVGVDLFFVLSGFLITGILVRSKGQAHYYRNFYARRSLRIWPLYIVLLVFIFAIANHRIPNMNASPNARWPIYALYLQNIVYPKGVDIAGILPLAITWSLAVEEQFYLVWPLLVAKLSIRHMVSVLCVIFAFAPFARYLVQAAGREAYTFPLCRIDAMAMGGLLAIWLAVKDPVGSVISKNGLILVGAAIAGQVIGHFAHISHYIDKSMAALAFTGLLALALQQPIIIRLLSLAPLRYTGKISYCMYLCHAVLGPVILYYFQGTSFSRAAIRAGLVLAATYGYATASWFLFEQPLLRFKKFFPERVSAVAKVPSVA
jgi:peptidoglycan/LPS O-acetylase OafA/YrhL